MRRKATWAVVVVAMLAVAGAVVAKATKTPVMSWIVDSKLVYLGEGFFDDEGILHVRGSLMEEYLEGDLEGVLYVDADFDVEFPAWTGDMRGELRFVGSWGDLEGTFEGRFSGTWEEGYFDGHWELKGTEGDFVGKQLKVDNYGPGSLPQVVEGIVLDPHGD
jgi:hypothetical protein